MESMIPRWYSARDVIHFPGSALASLDSCRCVSAHSETVCFGGGANAAKQDETRLFARLLSIVLYRFAGQLGQRFQNARLNRVFNLNRVGRSEHDRCELGRQ